MIYSGLINWGEFSAKVMLSIDDYDKESHEFDVSAGYYLQVIPNDDPEGTFETTGDLNDVD